MKRLFFTLTLCLALAVPASADTAYKNYQLIIDGKTYDVNLNEEIELKDASGRFHKVLLKQKKYKEYVDPYIRFQHRNDMSVSFSDQGNGVQQLVAATATGTLVMVQEISGVAPEFLVPLLLNELTKESVAFGYKMKQEKILRKAASGETLAGLKATLTYGNEETYWEVVSYGRNNTGVVVITSIDKEYKDKDSQVHRRFWKTLNILF